jgi:hypothetical protein
MNSIKFRMMMVLSLGILFFASTSHHGFAETPASAKKYGRSRYDMGAEPLAPLEVWLFTADDSVAANRGTLIVIGVRNNTHDMLTISNDIVVQPLRDDAVATTKPTTFPSTAHESTSTPTNLCARVFVRGKYPNSDFGTSGIMDLRLATLPLPNGQVEYFPTSVVGGFMQTGTYELQVVIYDGHSVVARSATRKITVNPPPGG